MFAPYCPTCRSRQLLGLSRIVRTDWESGGVIVVRCHCGTLLDADAARPPPTALRQAS